MRTSLALALGAVLVAAGSACSSSGDDGGGGTGGAASDAAATGDAPMCTAPSAALDCGQCTAAQCCPEQQACAADGVCTLAGIGLLLCGADGGMPSTCYAAFQASGGPTAAAAVDCAKARCKTECQL